MQTVVTAGRLLSGSGIVEDPVVVIADGRIASITSLSSAELPAGARLDFRGATLAPAFFDVHIHGAAGHDVMEATPEALGVMGKFLASHGTGRYLATTVTAPLDATLRSLAGLAKRIAQGSAGSHAGEAVTWPVGIHLEGPFLSHSKRGVHPPDLLLEPDVAVFDRLYDAAEGNIRLMTLAPELPGAVGFAAHAVGRGVRVSVGHSDATAAETRAVLAAGATSATHTFNAMRPLDHREPGILGVVLTTDDLFAELICDGIHNTAEMVKIWSRCKPADRAILITDGMSATGMPDGEYHLGGFAVQVADGRATANGVLAGSVLTLDRALANYLKFTGEPVERALQLLTANPAAMTGLGAAALNVGDAANLVAVDGAGRLITSFVNGVRATCGGADGAGAP
jgi:N-acetylglucosamine-6-phosphate deacetylase